MRGVLPGLLTVAGRGCAAALALALVLHGSTKRPPVRHSAAPAPPDVTDADIARGYRLVSVATNAALSYARPAGAAVHRPWGLRGAYEDRFWLGLGDFVLPLGTGVWTRLSVSAWGEVRPALRDRAHSIAAAGGPMSAVPGRSEFWWADGEGGSRVLTWRDFAPGRDASASLSAQLVLYPSGDFLARSGEVERAYRRVDPLDWDGDGWHNDDDPDPRRWTGGDFGVSQALPPDANSSAYYWVELSSALNARVRFLGDGPSNLPDPAFTLRAGSTNRVSLLAGKAYSVESSRPVSVVARSSPEVEVRGNGTRALSVRLPVTVRASDGGGWFSVHVWPGGLGGSFEWTQSCCPVSGYGNRFGFACGWSCACGGCAAEGVYSYEGYSLACTGGSCGCPYGGTGGSYATREDDGPYAASASVSFSAPAVVFEGAYTNAPGEIVSRRSTRTVLRCAAHGGERGAVVSFALEGADRLVRVSGGALPEGRFVPPGQRLDLEVVYEGRLPSGSERDIVARATAEDAGTGEISGSTDALTSVLVELRAVYEAPENPNPSRHIYGVGEQVLLTVLPSLSSVRLLAVKGDARDYVTQYDTFEGESEVDASVARVYTCPVVGGVPSLSITCGSVRYVPAMSVVEPQQVIVMDVFGRGSFVPGDVAMGVLVSRNYIGPMSVSFQGVQVYEVPCTRPIVPVGYFATTNYAGPLVHNDSAGAGIAHKVGISNFWATDEAGRSQPYESWTSGRMVWMIPIGWHRILPGNEQSVWAVDTDYERYHDPDSRPLLIGGAEDAYLQVFTIESNGTSSVQKFGYRLTRSRWSTKGAVTRE